MVRVLIVDDQPAFREVLKAILSEDRRLVIVGQAANGEQALAAVRELQPDLVLMDITMPVMDGLAACRELRRMNLPVPVLILTGSEAEIDRDRAAAAGANAFLTKSNLADVADRIIGLAS